MKYIYRFLCVAIVALFVASCDIGTKPLYEIGCKAEKIFFKDSCKVEDGFFIDTLWDEKTGCYYVETYSNNSMYELFSPEHNLLMVLGKSSECFCANGFKFHYDSVGRTDCVACVKIECDGLSCLDNDAFILKEMIRLYGNNDSAWTRYEIERDSCGQVIRVGDMNGSDLYEIEYGVYSGMNFWVSDIDGADLHFVVVKREKEPLDKIRPTFALYYVDGKLAVETLRKHGEPIKSVAYHHDGRVAALYGNEKSPLDIALGDYVLKYFSDKSLFCIDDLLTCEK